MNRDKELMCDIYAIQDLEVIILSQTRTFSQTQPSTFHAFMLKVSLELHRPSATGLKYTLKRDGKMLFLKQEKNIYPGQ